MCLDVMFLLSCVKHICTLARDARIARMSLGALSSQAVMYAAKCKRRMGLSAER